MGQKAEAISRSASKKEGQLSEEKSKEVELDELWAQKERRLQDEAAQRVTAREAILRQFQLGAKQESLGHQEKLEQAEAATATVTTLREPERGVLEAPLSTRERTLSEQEKLERDEAANHIVICKATLTQHAEPFVVATDQADVEEPTWGNQSVWTHLLYLVVVARMLLYGTHPVLASIALVLGGWLAYWWLSCSPSKGSAALCLFVLVYLVVGV